MIKVNLEIDKNFYTKRKNILKTHVKKKIRKIYQAFPSLKRKNICFTILITSPNKIKNLNLKFRKKNKTTDVLSFPFHNKFYFKKLKNKKIYLGDIALSYSILKVRSQKSSTLFEFDKLWVHGFLHLLGYNHVKNEDYKIMSSYEKKILN